MKQWPGVLASLTLVLASSGCVFHSQAKDFNGLVSKNGQPVNYTSTSKVGLRFLIVLPFLGDMDIDGLVDDMTAEIAESKGDKVRIVQAASENYWYGFPPFTWIITPVISTVAATYEPDPMVYQQEQEELRAGEEDESSINPTEW